MRAPEGRRPEAALLGREPLGRQRLAAVDGATREATRLGADAPLPAALLVAEGTEPELADAVPKKRTMWTGVTYGRRSSRCINYIACDVRAARRCRRGIILRHLCVPSDHVCVGQPLGPHDAALTMIDKQCSSRPKPVWALRPDKCGDELR